MKNKPIDRYTRTLIARVDALVAAWAVQRPLNKAFAAAVVATVASSTAAVVGLSLRAQQARYNLIWAAFLKQHGG